MTGTNLKAQSVSQQEQETPLEPNAATKRAGRLMAGYVEALHRIETGRYCDEPSCPAKLRKLVVAALSGAALPDCPSHTSGEPLQPEAWGQEPPQEPPDCEHGVPLDVCVPCGESNAAEKIRRLEKQVDHYRTLADGLDECECLLSRIGHEIGCKDNEDILSRLGALLRDKQEPCEHCKLIADVRWASNLCPYCEHVMGVEPCPGDPPGNSYCGRPASEHRSSVVAQQPNRFPEQVDAAKWDAYYGRLVSPDSVAAASPESAPIHIEAAERIVAAAIKQDGVVYTGPHHHQIIRYLFALTNRVVTGEQGFVTSTNRFVSRGEAGTIAKKSRQILAEMPGVVPPYRGELFSEHLWCVAALVGEPAPQAVESANEFAFDWTDHRGQCHANAQRRTGSEVAITYTVTEQDCVDGCERGEFVKALNRRDRAVRSDERDKERKRLIALLAAVHPKHPQPEICSACKEIGRL